MARPPTSVPRPMVVLPSAVVAWAVFQSSQLPLIASNPLSWKFTNLLAAWRNWVIPPSSIATTSPAPLPAAMCWVRALVYLPRSPVVFWTILMFGCAASYFL